MDEKVLLEWKDANAASLHTTIANLDAVTSDEGFDIDKLYSKAVETNHTITHADNSIKIVE